MMRNGLMATRRVAAPAHLEDFDQIGRAPSTQEYSDQHGSEERHAHVKAKRGIETRGRGHYRE